VYVFIVRFSSRRGVLLWLLSVCRNKIKIQLSLFVAVLNLFDCFNFELSPSLVEKLGRLSTMEC
jgi:hypothetical protein